MILNYYEYLAGEDPQDTLENIRHPENIWEIPDIRVSTEAGDKVGLIYEGYLHELDANIAISTSMESGISMREKILGITPEETDTLEARRIRVKLKWYDKTPYTIRSLRRTLENSFGDANVSVDVDGDNKILTCTIGIIDNSVYKSVYELLEGMVPVNYALKMLSNVERKTQGGFYVGGYLQSYSKVQIKDGGLPDAEL